MRFCVATVSRTKSLRVLVPDSFRHGIKEAPFTFKLKTEMALGFDAYERLGERARTHMRPDLRQSQRSDVLENPQTSDGPPALNGGCEMGPQKQWHCGGDCHVVREAGQGQQVPGTGRWLISRVCPGRASMDSPWPLFHVFRPFVLFKAPPFSPESKLNIETLFRSPFGGNIYDRHIGVFRRRLANCLTLRSTMSGRAEVMCQRVRAEGYGTLTPYRQ